MKVVVLLCAIAAVFASSAQDDSTCHEKPDHGLCFAYMPKYYYDTESGTCKKFIYGGCQGNGNRYNTEEACLARCSGVRRADVCTLPKKVGLCYGYFPRYYYDQNKGKCKKFIYGGCQGNENNFETLEECRSHCPVEQADLYRPDCDKAPEAGMCDAYMPRYYYDKDDGQCKTFVYGGCGGNTNNFRTEYECYDRCGARPICEQEKVVGLCYAGFRRYYFNKDVGKCELFIYGGCGGNDNNFESQEECEGTCVVSRASSDDCTSEPNTGPCQGYFYRYFYDPERKECDNFIYGGCGGNENNYLTEEECYTACST